MRYRAGFLILCVVGLSVLSVGCGQVCSDVGCIDGVQIDLVPEIEVNYDVTLMLDGEAEAFACVRYYDDLREAWLWRMQPPYGISSCDGKGFLWSFGFNGTGTVPESVEITVTAEDGSWNGSLTASPTYQVVQPNGPDCPPTCHQAGLTIANDVGAFEVQP